MKLLQTKHQKGRQGNIKKLTKINHPFPGKFHLSLGPTIWFKTCGPLIRKEKVYKSNNLYFTINIYLIIVIFTLLKKYRKISEKMFLSNMKLPRF